MINMTEQLKRIFESDIKNAHRENEEMILKRNDLSIEICLLNNRIKTNMEYIRTIQEIIREYDRTPDQEGIREYDRTPVQKG